jgi:hypothetical protein
MKGECAPSMLMNCPSFREAQRIWESLDIRRVMFVSDLCTDTQAGHHAISRG